MPWDKKPQARGLVSGAVLWTGLALIVVLAVPAAILFGMILLIWEIVDFILRKIEKI